MPSAFTPQPLRIGLIVSSPQLRAWQVRAIQELRLGHRASLALVIMVPRTDGSLSPAARLLDWYERVDRRTFMRRHDDACLLVDTASVLSGLPRLALAPDSPLTGHIADAVDVLLDFSGHAGLAGLARAVPCGV